MIYSPSSHAHDFLLSDKYNQSYLKNILALSSLIMAVNCLKLKKVNPFISFYLFIYLFDRDNANKHSVKTKHVTEVLHI